MKPDFQTRVVVWAGALMLAGMLTSGCTPSIKFTKPPVEVTQAGDPIPPKVQSPVEICMDVKGYILRPAEFDVLEKPKKEAKNTSLDVSADDGYGGEFRKNLVDPSSGHYHLLIDVPLAAGEEVNLHRKKDKNHIPMVDGSRCKTLYLEPGMHRIRAVFAHGNHVPVAPLLTNTLTVIVE